MINKCNKKTDERFLKYFSNTDSTFWKNSKIENKYLLKTHLSLELHPDGFFLYKNEEIGLPIGSFFF